MGGVNQMFSPDWNAANLLEKATVQTLTSNTLLDLTKCAVGACHDESLSLLISVVGVGLTLLVVELEAIRADAHGGH